MLAPLARGGDVAAAVRRYRFRVTISEPASRYGANVETGVAVRIRAREGR